VIPSLEDRLAAAEALILAAGFSVAPEIPGVLCRAVAILESVRGAIQGDSPPDRLQALARLRSFQAKLLSFSSGMRRSETIFQGYTRHAGVSLSEYGPAGVATGARAPAFVDLTV
jgi:hypothetical protein